MAVGARRTGSLTALLRVWWLDCHRTAATTKDPPSLVVLQWLEAYNMLVVSLQNRQAYYDFPHPHSFHRVKPAMKSVAVRKLRGPRGHRYLRAMGIHAGGTWCAPLYACTPSSCTALT